VSTCSKDFSLLKNNSICQRSRYSPRTASAGSSAALRVVSIQMISAWRVREAMARTGIQATALAESHVLWLLFWRSGGTGKMILNSTAPVAGTSASLSCRKMRRRFSSQVRSVTGLNRTTNMSLSLYHGIYAARRSISPVS
jgi:hypothetical protein